MGEKYVMRRRASMAWREGPRRVEPRSILLFVIIHLFSTRGALAADADVTVGPGPTSECPSSDAVWSTVIKLVPSEADRLLAAKPRVEILDLGERYRVRVATDGGTLERVYADPARECEKRTRFAAEFVVVSLLPPQLDIPPDATSAASRLRRGPGVPAGDSKGPSNTAPDAARPAASAPSPAATQTPPPPPLVPLVEVKPAGPPTPGPDRSASPSRPSRLRLELAAIGDGSPPLASPGLLMWGGELRARIGARALAAVASIGYLPRVGFGVGDFTGSLTRVSAMAGARARVVKRYLNIDADLALAAAYESYEGVSPHIPSDATRVSPGLEVGLIAAPHPRFGLAPIAGVRCAWFPFTQELATAPQGNLGNTPSLWIGAELGVSLEL